MNVRSDLLERHLREWAEARTHRLNARRAMLACRCERYERPWDDAPGVAACFRQWAFVAEEWCEACIRRQPIYQQMLSLRRIEKALFRKLTALIDRRAKARTVDAVYPSAASPGMPSTRDSES